MASNLDPTGRFSSRVADYVKYRPTYPPEVLRLLREATGLTPEWTIADIGSGTGISSRLFLANGNTVYGVEPNDAMRLAAEEEFAGQMRFHSVNGTAEATSIPAASIDLIVAAQAFHWFDRPATAREFRRILRPSPGGWVVLLWNQRLHEIGPFAAEYDALLHRYGTDYKEVAHRTPVTTDELAAIFGAPFVRYETPNEQVFTFEELCGRVRSASYTPHPGEPNHEPMYAGLRQLFDAYQVGGTVRFDYTTEIFCGRLLGK